MLNVPLGVPLTAATSASLMSHWASGPERIGWGADVVPWPQATASHSASTVRTTNIPLWMALLSSLIAMANAFLSLTPTRLSESTLNFQYVAPSCHNRPNALFAHLSYETIF